jgi:hypothetical protein
MNPALVELSQKMPQAVTDIGQLNNSLQLLAKAEAKFHLMPNPARNDAETVLRADSDVVNFFKTSCDTLTSLIRTVEALLHESAPVRDTNAQIPSQEEVKNRLTGFFLGKPNIKSAPLPPYTGCHAHKMKTNRITPGQFICACYRNAFVLMIVVAYQEQVCMAYDPTALGLAEFQFDEWTPLTTVIPDKPQQRWEFSQGTTVLSLLPQSQSTHVDGDWSMEFFPAKVVKRPCDRVGDEERGYLLNFGEKSDEWRDSFVVPEQFVVTYPDTWPRQ